MSCDLALNIYSWGAAGKTRLLHELLLPALEPLYLEGRLTRWLFDRFDARGPHLFVLLGAPSQDQRRRLEEDLAAQIESFQAAFPCREELTEEALWAQHAACRGKSLCALDRLDGLASNNSFLFAPQGESDYPFSIFRRTRDVPDFWRAFADESFWAISQLAASDGRAMGPALRWAATFDHTLEELGVDAESYWRYHLCTLLPALAERFEAEAPAAVLASLAPLVKEKNRQVFGRIWQVTAAEEGRDPRAVALLRSLLRGFGAESEFAAPREVFHLSLKQLGLELTFQISIVLYAWQRRIEVT